MGAGTGLITASVGARGVNRRGEVILVQHVFNRASVGMPALEEDDLIGPVTIGRIREYQTRVLGFAEPDGLVDPDGRTLRSLLERIALRRSGSAGAVHGGAAPAVARRASQAATAAAPRAMRAQTAVPRLNMSSGGGKLTEQDFVAAAAALGAGIEPELVHAVADVESGGRSGFNAAGLPVIAYEGHRFRKLTGGIYDRTHPLLSYPYVKNAGWQWQTNNAGQVKAWETLNRAAALNHDAALLSCSWGMFQVMGDNFGKCGYSGVDAFVAAMKTSEGKQLEAFVAYCRKTPGMIPALRTKNFEGIARAYNGNDVAIYAGKFRRAYAKYKR